MHARAATYKPAKVDYPVTRQQGCPLRTGSSWQNINASNGMLCNLSMQSMVLASMALAEQAIPRTTLAHDARRAAPLLHEDEGVVAEVAVIVDVRLDAPIVVHVGKERVMVKEAAEVAAHVMIRLPPA